MALTSTNCTMSSVFYMKMTQRVMLIVGLAAAGAEAFQLPSAATARNSPENRQGECATLTCKSARANPCTAALPEASLHRQQVLHAAACALLGVSAAPADAASAAVKTNSDKQAGWLMREFAPDPLVEAKNPLEQDFDERYGKKSQYAKRLIAPAKIKGLPIDEVLDIIREDFSDRQYFVTGNMTKSIYADDCRFRDPTTDVRGLQRYILAVSNLFEPSASRAQLLSITALSDTAIRTEWVLEGTLKLPWKPYIPPVKGSTIYTLNRDRLISMHDEVWNVSALDAVLAVVGIRVY